MKEYSYEIDKYIVGVDSNGEDGIGLTIATMKDNELHILGSCYGDNARFIDLLIKENQELKKQLEEYKRLGFKHLNDKCNKSENQQKKFISYLENMLDNENDIFSVVRVKDVLSKYKEIIGGKE